MKSIRIRHLCSGAHQKGGRANSGQITVPRRGALVKHSYRFLDTKRVIKGSGLIINPYLYDPNRSGYISLVMMPNGLLTYILAANLPKEQSRIYNLQEPPKRNEKGWSNYLKLIPLGTIIFNIEMIPGAGAKIARAAGNSAILLSNHEKLGKNVLLKLKSGEHRLVSSNAVASIGVTSHDIHFLRNYRTAGTIRRYGFRPKTRPSAMNPVDHPMAGRTKGGCAPKNRNGLLTGTKTSTKKNHHLILKTARFVRLQK